MKIGIFGSNTDQQCLALQKRLKQRGVDVVMVESQGLNMGHSFSYENGHYRYRGQDLEDVGAWYLRYVMSPLPPSFSIDDDYYLYADWFHAYMNRRERFGFQLSFLLSEELRGIPMLNPPAFGSVLQQKPYQLQVARKVGMLVPDTLITNDPSHVRAMVERLGGVVYKPSLGGGLCEVLDAKAMQRLDRIVAAPVTFQEQVRGLSIRVTIVGDELVSCVGIPSDSMDYRDDTEYKKGSQQYTQETLPPELFEQTKTLMQTCGLMFSGVDFIRTDDGRHVFLEANSSPIFLDIERKTQTPITDMMATYMLRLANEPAEYQERRAKVSPDLHFLSYCLPFAPKKLV